MGKSLAQAVKVLRTKGLRLSQPAFAKELKVSAQSVEKWEAEPADDHLPRLAELAKVSFTPDLENIFLLEIARRKSERSNNKSGEPLPSETGRNGMTVVPSEPRGNSEEGEFDPWVAKVKHILHENNPYAAPSLKKNIEAFERLTNIDGGAIAPPPGKGPKGSKDPIDQAERAERKAARLREEVAGAPEKHPRKRQPGRKVS